MDVLNAVLHLWASTITSSPRIQRENSEDNPALSFATFVWSVWGGTSHPPPLPPTPSVRPSSSLSLLSEAEKCLPHWSDLTSHQSNMAAEMWDKVKIPLLSEEGDVNLQLLVYFSSSYSPNWTGTRNHPSDEIKYLQLKCLNPRVQQTSDNIPPPDC